MELRHLRYFVAVAETENVSRAALKLPVSQPALSRQVRDLEDEIGFLLLERSAKSVRLTDAGRIFLTEARAVLARTEDAVQAARAVATGLRGELHVGYAPTPTVRILPATLRAFQAERSEVRVKLHDLTTDEMIAGLRKGALQIALLVRPSRAMLRGLHVEELARDQIRLAVPPDHPFAKLRSFPSPGWPVSGWWPTIARSIRIITSCSTRSLLRPRASRASWRNMKAAAVWSLRWKLEPASPWWRNRCRVLSTRA